MQGKYLDNSGMKLGSLQVEAELLKFNQELFVKSSQGIWKFKSEFVADYTTYTTYMLERMLPRSQDLNPGSVSVYLI